MGGCRCCFRQCQVATERNKGMHFFKFPLQHPDRFEQWIKLAGVEHFSKLNKSELHNKVICARHFPHTHFMNYKNNRLTVSAKPTLNRISEEYALDYSIDVNSPSLIKLPPVTQPHLIPPEGFPNTMHFIAADRKIAEEIIKSFQLDAQLENSEVIKTHKRKESFEINSQEAKKPKTVSKPQVTNDNYVIFFGEDESALTESISSDDDLTETSVVHVVKDDNSKDIKKSIRELTDIKTHKDSFIVECPGGMIPNQQKSQFLSKKCMPETLKVKELEECDKELNLTKNKLLMAEKRVSALNLKVEELTGTNEKLKRQIEMTEKQFKEVNDELMYINTAYETLQREHSELQKKSCILKKQQQQEYVSSTGQQQQQQPQSQQQLTKVQLFNGIKKYLSQTMVALLRIQLSSGSSEREWKPDERRLAIDLMGLGEQIYKYFTDEWLLRLPSLRQVQLWRNEATTFDQEDDI